MASKTFVYQGNKITVQFDAKRCIHAAECVRGLPGVFNPSKKPWVDPDAAPADEIAAVIARCPSGALQFKRSDGGPDEAAGGYHSIGLIANGPLYLQGRLQLSTPDGRVVAQGTRMALCRCGASQNKPFCDGSHTKIGFQDEGLLGKTAAVLAEGAECQELTISSLPNGPLAVSGVAKITSADGSTSWHGSKLFLCRCGASSNKPFCDGSHARMGFVTE